MTVMTVVACLSALLAVAGAAGSAYAGRALAGSLSFSDAVVPPATRVTLSGSLPPQRARTVRLQRRASGSWVTVTSKKSTSTGRFSFAVTSATAAGPRAYRVLAPATTLGGKRYAAVATPSHTLTVVRLVDVDAGWRHACAVGSNGRAWCWGDNTYGELGDGKGATFDDAHPLVSGPVRVSGTGWSSVSAAGASTCGLRSDRTAWCWGDHAQVVSGVPKAASPVKAAGSWRQIATGWSYVCGVDTAGTGRCWGQDEGQLGSAAAVPQGTKHALPGTWTMVEPGSMQNTPSTCGVRTDHTAWCWGANGSGQLGDGSTDPSRVPVQVAGEHEWRSVTVGTEHACGVDTDGVGWCWGSNLGGRLGDSTVAERHTPVRVQVATGWRRLDAGYQHTCGVTSAGGGWCWGQNEHGELGDGTTETGWFPPTKAQRFDGTWPDLAAGHNFTVGAAGGLARAWGLGDLGQTGHGREPTPRLTPRRVTINP